MPCSARQGGNSLIRHEGALPRTAPGSWGFVQHQSTGEGPGPAVTDYRTSCMLHHFFLVAAAASVQAWDTELFGQAEGLKAQAPASRGAPAGLTLGVSPLRLGSLVEQHRPLLQLHASFSSWSEGISSPVASKSSPTSFSQAGPLTQTVRSSHRMT